MRKSRASTSAAALPVPWTGMLLKRGRRCWQSTQRIGGSPQRFAVVERRYQIFIFFLLLQDDEHDEHARFAMNALITKGAYPYFEGDNASLTQLLSNAINKGGDKLAPRTRRCIETGDASKQVQGTSAPEMA